jgi:hypothetical protein
MVPRGWSRQRGWLPRWDALAKLSRNVLDDRAEERKNQDDRHRPEASPRNARDEQENERKSAAKARS